MYRIRITDLEQWLVSFDPEISETDPPTYPTGYLITSSAPEQALKFPSFLHAAAYWKMESKSVPLRPDGKPNRPLTAYSVTIEPC